MNIADIIARAGGVVSLARACGVRHTTVIGWRNRSTIPARHLRAVAKASGVKLADLLPRDSK